MSRPEAVPDRSPQGAAPHDEALVAFLVSRLTEDLALLWEREDAREHDVRRPGLAAQVAIVDEMLAILRSGLLPSRRELRMLLYGYGAHPDYDTAWTHELSRAT